MKTGKFWKRFLLIALLLSFLGGLGLRLYFSYGSDSNLLLSGDSSAFYSLAKNINKHKEFSIEKGRPTAYRLPGYAYFLAGLMRIFGDNPQRLAAAQAALIMILLIFLTSVISYILFDIYTALIAGIISCLYPHFIFYSLKLGNDIAFLIPFLISFYLLHYFIKRGKLYSGILSAIFLGISMLTKSVASMFLPLPAFFILFFHKTPLLKRIALIFIFYIFVMLTISPWLARNHIHFGRYFLRGSATGGSVLGYKLAEGNNKFIDKSAKEYEIYFRKVWSQSNDENLKEFKNYLATNPAHFVKSLFYKIYMLYRPWPNLNAIKLNHPNYGYKYTAKIILSGFIQLLIYIFFILYFVFHFKDFKTYFPTIYWIAANTALFMIFYPVQRYRLVLMPFFIILAGRGVATLAEMIALHKKK